MKSGYKIVWTENALQELQTTIEYLEAEFSEKELARLAQKIEDITVLISQNPQLFSKSSSTNIFRVPVLRLNTLYYRVQENTIEILSFFSNRQSPQKKKFE